MLDLGFVHDVRRIARALPKERRTLMFSATWPDNVAKLAADLLNDPVRIEAGSKLASLTGVEQLDVISRHHQALTDVRDPWKVSAMDEEGLVEAI